MNQSAFQPDDMGGLAAAVGLVSRRCHRGTRKYRFAPRCRANRFQAIQSALRALTVSIIGATIYPHVVFLPIIPTGVTGTLFRALVLPMTVALGLLRFFSR